MTERYVASAQHLDNGFFARAVRVAHTDQLLDVLELAAARPLPLDMTQHIRSCASLAHAVLVAGISGDSALVGREEGLDLCAALLMAADQLSSTDHLVAFALEAAGNRVLEAFVGRDDIAP